MMRTWEIYLWCIKQVALALRVGVYSWVNSLETHFRHRRIHNMDIVAYVIFALIVINIVTEIRRS